MIPAFDSFEWFASLLPLLALAAPALVALRRGAGRQALLVVTGLYLLFLIAPRLALFHLAMWLVVAALAQLVSVTGERRAGLAVLWGALAVTLLPLVAWKVWPVDFVVDFNVWGHRLVAWPSGWLEAVDHTADVVAPIGLSFSTFRAADLLVKSNLGLVDRLPPGRVLAYGLFPPLLVVGPIASYDEARATVEGHVPLTRERVLHGVTEILTGLFKVFAIAYLLDWSVDVFALADDNPPWRLWLGLIAFAWYFYINFAGYSDMAIGAGRLLGADLRPNFASPYTKTTPTAFWNSWHISLTRVLRANVFTPMVGRHPERQYAATMLTMLLIGLWHSVTWASALFGAYHGASLVAHRVVERRRPARPGALVRWAKSVAVFAWFALSLPLLNLDLDDAGRFYAAIVGLR